MSSLNSFSDTKRERLDLGPDLQYGTFNLIDNTLLKSKSSPASAGAYRSRLGTLSPESSVTDAERACLRLGWLTWKHSRSQGPEVKAASTLTREFEVQYVAPRS